MVENIKMISYKEKDPKKLDLILAKVNSNKLLKGTVKYFNSIDPKTGEVLYCYNALSRI